MEKFIILEIKAIKKVELILNSNIELVPIDNIKIYYDATRQVIVIDGSLQQSLTFELVNTKGQVTFRKISIDSSTSISISNLPNGVYIYRLLQNNRMIYSDKILKYN